MTLPPSVPRPVDPRTVGAGSGTVDPEPAVARALAELDGLTDRPPAEHVAVFERLHATLQGRVGRRIGRRRGSRPRVTAVVARARLDAELVRRGLARSRQQAAELIAQGRVAVHGVAAGKAATVVDRDTPVTIRETAEREWASRGAHKLIGALDAFADVVVAGRRCLDAGASTGGFTDVLLDRGAAEVVAVDVGYGQLVWRLRVDDRVTVHDRTNIRSVGPDDLGGSVDLTVADLSFISLRTVLPALVACTAADGELLPMVKPQFEVGRERLGAGGVVRDPTLRRAALGDVASAARGLGLVLRGAVASPLPGPSGNVEYFLRLARDTRADDVGDSALDRAVAEGPGERACERTSVTASAQSADRAQRGSAVSVREVLVVLHVGRSTNRYTAAAVARRLAADGVRLRMLGDEWKAVTGLIGDLPSELAPRVVDARPGCAEGAEVALVLGGDGTLLRAAETARPVGVPLLGVNLGHVGFLAEAEQESLNEALKAIIEKSYDVEERMTLDAVAVVNGDEIARSWALNEVSVEKSSRERILEVALEVDCRPVSAFGCDGVLCSTPTGSTAYAFSAGGPIVWPQVQALLLVPSNAHALFARPMVVSPDSQVAIEILPTSPSAVLDCDGRRTAALPPGARVEVIRGTPPVRMVLLDGRPFADRLVRKFDLPIRGWRGAPPRVG